MSELGLNATAKFKKSARTVVTYWVNTIRMATAPAMKRWCDGAAILLSLSAGGRAGELGPPDDPKSFAAMRYTESRLSKIPSFY